MMISNQDLFTYIDENLNEDIEDYSKKELHEVCSHLEFPVSDSTREIRNLLKEFIEFVHNNIENEDNLHNLFLKNNFSEIISDNSNPVVEESQTNLSFEEFNPAPKGLPEEPDRNNIPNFLQYHIEKLNHSEWRIRQDSAAKLEEFGEEITEILLDFLSTTEDDNIQYWILRTIGKFNTLTALDVLMKVHDNPRSETIKIYSIMAMGQIKEKRSILFLINLLNSPSWSIAESAHNSLVNIGAISETYIKGALKASPENMVYWLIRTVAMINIRSVSLIIKTGSIQHKLFLADILKDIQSKEAISLLLYLLRDESARIRNNTIQALKAKGNQVIIPLLKFVQKENSEEITLLAEEIFNNMKFKITDTLIKLLEHEDSQMNIWALKFLGQIDSEISLRLILKTLDHPHWLVCKAAIEALSKICLFHLDPLQSLLNDPDTHKNVIYGISRAMMDCPSEMTLSILKSSLENGNKDIKQIIARVFENASGYQVLDTLLVTLADPSWPVRKVAAETISVLNIPIEFCCKSFISSFITVYRKSKIEYDGFFKLNKVLDEYEDEMLKDEEKNLFITLLINNNLDDNIHYWAGKIIETYTENEHQILTETLRENSNTEKIFTSIFGLSYLQNADTKALLEFIILNNTDQWNRKLAAAILPKLYQDNYSELIEFYLPFLTSQSMETSDFSNWIERILLKIVEVDNNILAPYQKKESDPNLLIRLNRILASSGNSIAIDHFLEQIESAKEDTLFEITKMLEESDSLEEWIHGIRRANKTKITLAMSSVFSHLGTPMIPLLEKQITYYETKDKDFSQSLSRMLYEIKKQIL